LRACVIAACCASGCSDAVAPTDAGGASQAGTGGRAGAAGAAGVPGAAGQPAVASDSGTRPVDAGSTEHDAGSDPPAGEPVDAAVHDAGGEGMPAHAPLSVTASSERHEHRFKPSQADAEVDPSTTFSDGDQVAIVDPRAATLMGKLVVSFGGQGSTTGYVGGVGNFAAARGFHVLGVTYYTAYNIVRGDPDFYGDARLEVFEGIDHTEDYEFASVHIGKPDCVETRVAKALAYLQGLYPEEDWGYYLNADGSVRWSDVIATGMSHGASAVARIGMVRTLARVVSLSGPRDNSCGTDPECATGTVAAWFDEVPLTPIDRFFAMTGVMDSQHPEHRFAMEKLGYVGELVDVDVATAPFGGSHRLSTSSAGHADFCGDAKYEAACNYMFDVPPENADGAP
jgi:hypothetical protein